MKPSEKKQKYVERLKKLYKKLDVDRLYIYPNQNDNQKWIADVRSVLKNLDESDYQEFVRLSKTVGLSDIRDDRKKAAKEIKQFLGSKVGEYEDQDYTYLDKEEITTKKMGFNYWNIVNPFWLIYKLIVFTWKHKLITAIIMIVTLLGIDYSLAWKNTLWVFNAMVSIFPKH